MKNIKYVEQQEFQSLQELVNETLNIILILNDKIKTLEKEIKKLQNPPTIQ